MLQKLYSFFGVYGLCYFMDIEFSFFSLAITSKLFSPFYGRAHREQLKYFPNAVHRLAFRGLDESALDLCKNERLQQYCKNLTRLTSTLMFYWLSTTIIRTMSMSLIKEAVAKRLLSRNTKRCCMSSDQAGTSFRKHGAILNID